MAKEKLYRVNVSGSKTTGQGDTSFVGNADFMKDGAGKKDSEIKNVFLPIARDTLEKFLKAAADRGLEFAQNEVFPEVEKRGKQFYRFLRRNIKERYERRKLRKLNSANKADKVVPFDENKELHTKEEVNQIMTNMKYAAYYIATRIDELSDIAASDKDDTEKKSEMESMIKELDTDDIKSIIDFMLEKKNKYLIDKETLRKFKVFKNNKLIVNGEIVLMPVSIFSESNGSDRVLLDK